MSFKPFEFKYVPPPTVPESSTYSDSVQQSGVFTMREPANILNTEAGKLLARVQDMLATNQYLQSMILASSKGLGVEFDPSVNPVASSALQTLYPNQSVPTSLTIDMYNRTLDAEMTVMQINAGLGNEAAYEVNPIQSGAISTISGIIEDGLIASGQFQYQFPLLLGPLKGDAVVFNTMAEGISKYPVIASPGTAELEATPALLKLKGQDISSSLALTLNNALDDFQSSYASVYQLASDVGGVASDVNNVLSQYFLAPASQILHIISLFKSLIGFTHIPKMKGIVKGLTGMVFVEMLCEAMGMQFLADRFIQTAVQPLRLTVSNISSMVSRVQLAIATGTSVIQGVEQSAIQTEGVLKGLSTAYTSGLPYQASAKTATSKPLVVPGIGELSKGMVALSTHLNWATNTAIAKVSQLDESLHKLVQRRLGDMNSQLAVLDSLRTLNTLTQLAQSVMTFNGNQPSSGATGVVSSIEAVGQILGGMQSSTGITYTLANGQIAAVPASVPTLPSAVQTVLKNGGLNLIAVSSSTIQTTTIGAVK